MSKKLYLLRDVRKTDVTLSRIRFESDVEDFCFALEEPWRDNASFVSCIPAGRYRCRRRFSNRFQRDVFEVLDVPNRSAILFHVGNTTDDVEGCIVLGESRDISGGVLGKPTVLESRAAFSRFMSRLDGIDEFILVIEEV